MTNVLRSGSRRLRLLIVAVVVVAVAGSAIASAAVRRLDGSATAGVGALRLDPPDTLPAGPGFQNMVGMVDLVNAERARLGLAALEWHDQVAAAAAAHSADMAAHGVMSHTGSDGSNAGDRLGRQGLAGGWGETIGAGPQHEQQMFQSWMASAPHRTILLGDYRYVGVAAVSNGSGTPYWTLDVTTGA